MFHQPAHFAFVKCAAEMPAEAGNIGGDTEQFRSLRAVVSDEPLGMASIKEWVTGDKRPHLGVISLRPEVTARQIRSRRPGIALFSDGCADLFQSMFRQPPVGGQLASEDIEQRRFALCLFNLQHIVACGFLRL
ncbi:hypothetical protein D3C87_1652630 [compost metagenome]